MFVEQEKYKLITIAKRGVPKKRQLKSSRLDLQG